MAKGKATKFLKFNSEAEALQKEFELRGLTKCISESTKTNKYADVIVNKDGTAMLPIEEVYNHETKQMMDAEQVLSLSEKSVLLSRTDKAVVDAIDNYDDTRKG